MQRYDAIVDLQNHRISRIIRMLLNPKAWTEFDRTSPMPAGERTSATIAALGLASTVQIDTNFKFRIENGAAKSLLKQHGWNGESQLMIVNPAGNFPSRNWPLDNYIEFVQRWAGNFQCVLLLTAQHHAKSTALKKVLGDQCIDLSGKTTQVEAFAIVGHAKFVLSEDSGLMHMAWVQGVPTLALFGSTRKDWSQPLGEWSECLDSSDLECGPCMLEVCKFGDNRCLTRYSAKLVDEKARQLFSRAQKTTWQIS
jgi:ADP-heptose:LPS heptosyltransferase